MIRRPLNSQFTEAVLGGRKTTTIRDKPWPVGKPIMLFNWSGAPYRSSQIDVAAVEVENVCDVFITRGKDDSLAIDTMSMTMLGGSPPLWQTEGFVSGEAMRAWFLPLVKPGETIMKHLMRFRRVES
jgi:hypothetical protein